MVGSLKKPVCQNTKKAMMAIVENPSAGELDPFPHFIHCLSRLHPTTKKLSCQTLNTRNMLRLGRSHFRTMTFSVIHMPRRQPTGTLVPVQLAMNTRNSLAFLELPIGRNVPVMVFTNSVSPLLLIPACILSMLQALHDMNR